jgi:hypothetical protein
MSLHDFVTQFSAKQWVDLQLAAIAHNNAVCKLIYFTIQYYSLFCQLQVYHYV